MYRGSGEGVFQDEGWDTAFLCVGETWQGVVEYVIMRYCFPIALYTLSCILSGLWSKDERCLVRSVYIVMLCYD